MADGSQVRALVARLRTLRRVVVRVDIALSLAQAALWAVLIDHPGGRRLASPSTSGTTGAGRPR